MSAVRQLESMGLSLNLDQNNWFILGGLKKLPPESRRQAVAIARQYKPAILEELKRRVEDFIEQSTAALEHARRMLVECPSTGGKLHCWHCSRCSDARRCMAWRSRRADVEFFRRSERPYSLYLVEEMAAPEVLQ